MPLTEHDAKTKWCPFARVALSAGMAANRTAALGRGGYADIHDETRCLAGGCMAWRHAPRSNLEEPAAGFCGLAGPDE